jgi:hypothetical protein
MLTVTETASMEECNGTNQKPIPPVLKCTKIRDVLVHRRDSWLVRLQGNSTLPALKVLKKL